MDAVCSPILVPSEEIRVEVGIPDDLAGVGGLLVFIGLLVAGAVFVLPKYSMAGFVTYVVVLSMLFAAVCRWKGEPPRWRWDGE